MSLKLNLGDIVRDEAFDHTVIVVAKASDNGEPLILEGYENNPEVKRVFPLIEEPEGRVVIILENGPKAFLQEVGDGYYTWTEDPSLTEELK